MRSSPGRNVAGDRARRVRPGVGRLAMLLAWGALAVPIASAGTFTPAWDEASRLLPAEAHRRFTAPAAADGRGREARLGEAITLLNLQPRTEEHVQRGRRLLEELVAARVDDQVDVFAGFFLARWFELQAEPADPAAAAREYRRLLAAHPGDPLAERGAAQLVLIELYATLDSRERARRCDALDRLGPRLTTASGRRDFYLNLGNACLDFGLGNARALRCLQAADAAGLTDPATRADTAIALGELARVTGQPELARTYYRRFLADFPRDNRRSTIEHRLAGLAGEPARGAADASRPGEERE